MKFKNDTKNASELTREVGLSTSEAVLLLSPVNFVSNIYFNVKIKI